MSESSPKRTIIVACLALWSCTPSASGGLPTGPTTAADSGVDAAPLAAIDPRVFGRADLGGVVFAAFTQSAPNARDTQLLDLAPDLTPRAWARWDTYGTKPTDYDFGYPAAAHGKKIMFLGGTTASVIFKDEVTPAEFLDQASRDASGALVLHAEIVPNAYRGALASAAFRARLIEIAKVQIDGGVDGIFFDEVNSGYQGTKYDGNEGFDDQTVADFGRYLCLKYAAAPSKLADFGVTAADKLDCSTSDPGSAFDYRGFLARHGAQTAPTGAKNPLAAEWGTTVQNRPDPAKGSFLETYPPLVYWQQVVLEARTYARSKYSKELLITANGIFPFVDFQSVGLYDWNKDGAGTRGFDWVPLVDGHLAGSVSFVPTLGALRARSKRIVEAAGGKEVPLLLFLDWPTDSMNRYYALPASERRDYFRLYMAEAAALGMWFAAPLSTTTDASTATALGMLETFTQLRSFYTSHRDIYRSPTPLSTTPTVSAPNTASTICQLADGRLVVHVINHAYRAGVISASGVTVSWPMATAPSSVTLASPDYTSDRAAVFTYSAGIVTATVGALDAYVAIVAR